MIFWDYDGLTSDPLGSTEDMVLLDSSYIPIGTLHTEFGHLIILGLKKNSSNALL